MPSGVVPVAEIELVVVAVIPPVKELSALKEDSAEPPVLISISYTWPCIGSPKYSMAKRDICNILKLLESKLLNVAILGIVFEVSS